MNLHTNLDLTYSIISAQFYTIPASQNLHFTCIGFYFGYFMSFSFHYIQFLSLRISFSSAPFLILDISHYFPVIISNFCLLEFLFHLHYS